MDIEKLVKMSNAVYLVCEEPVADDISDSFKWAISRIKELEAERDKLAGENIDLAQTLEGK